MASNAKALSSLHWAQNLCAFEPNQIQQLDRTNFQPNQVEFNEIELKKFNKKY